MVETLIGSYMDGSKHHTYDGEDRDGEETQNDDDGFEKVFVYSIYVLFRPFY